MKPFLSILCIALLFLPLWGMFGYLTVQKKQVQKSVKRQIMKGVDREELIFMAFSQEELHTQLNWKHSKEFEYNGEMYDIVESKQTTDSAFYWVWWDNEETELNRRVNRIASELFGQNPNQHEKSQVVKTFYISFFIEFDNFTFKKPTTSLSTSIFQYLIPHHEEYYEIPDPPPKQLFLF